MIRVIIIFLILLLVSPIVMAESPGSPLEVVGTKIDSVENIINNIEDKDAREKAIKKEVDEIFDIWELSQRALANHWKGLSEAQRKDFTTTLNQLIENSYLRFLGSKNKVEGKRRELDHRLTKEEVNGNYAAVYATVLHKDVDFLVQYKLTLKDGRWVVYDVIIDDASVLENYKSQFNQIIAESSFAGLLDKMRKKLEESKSKT